MGIDENVGRVGTPAHAREFAGPIPYEMQSDINRDALARMTLRDLVNTVGDEIEIARVLEYKFGNLVDYAKQRSLAIDQGDVKTYELADGLYENMIGDFFSYVSDRSLKYMEEETFLNPQTNMAKNLRPLKLAVFESLNKHAENPQVSGLVSLYFLQMGAVLTENYELAIKQKEKIDEIESSIKEDLLVPN